MRVAHIASAIARADFFELLGSNFFNGQTCARKAHSERVSAKPIFFWRGKHVRGAYT